MTFFSGIKCTPSGCYNLASTPTPSLSPYACKFFGFESPPTIDLEEERLFILIALMALDSLSATYSSIWLADINPMVNPEG